MITVHKQQFWLEIRSGSRPPQQKPCYHKPLLLAGRQNRVPIKALANEKFLALCEIFGPEQVGMITGDATVNSEAPVICCTAEILSNMALREGSLAKVDEVIMDEFHYYSDHERGVAWQIPLLTLPQARFLLMSATLGETEVFQKEFKNKLNISTMGYYRGLRLDLAQNLLRNSSLSVTEISLATGFSGSAHFSSCYSQKFGGPPSSQRR